MIKKSKRTIESSEDSTLVPKKLKKSAPQISTEEKVKIKTKPKASDQKEKKPKFSKKFENKDGKFKKKPLPNKGGFQSQPNPAEKTDWIALKQEKKELKIKRKKAKGLYEISVEAKKIAEELRKKELKTNKKQRTELVNKLRAMLSGKGFYAKLVLIHDTARIVQYLLKFGSEDIRKEVTQDLIPISVDMLQSKYGRYCFKSMLKYGNNEIRSAAIKTLYGHAVKLTSHGVSAAVFEYAYSTWASHQQKQHLIQEFFGEMYRQTKDDNVKHLRDVYKDSPTMKTAALQATKGNLSRILNKNLLDSGLVQSVLSQYLSECTAEDKNELISQLASHVVILSNSKDGVRVAMQCFWHGSNKERKTAMKAIKEHVTDLCKHEHGHGTVIALLDAADDTVLVNKMIISQILTDVETLAKDEWGRKIILWLVAPADSVHFHPLFIKELEAGLQASTSKKTPDIRRKELLNYIVPSLLQLVASKAEFWLANASVAMITLAILKSSFDHDVSDALQSVAETIADRHWKVKDDENEIQGIEHSGLHMILKKLAQHDKTLGDADTTFGKAVLDALKDKAVKLWLTLNRACFLLVVIYENGTESTQQQMKQKLSTHLNLLQKQNSQGAKILLKKLS